MLRKMLLVSAISAAFAATPSIAQQQGGQQQGGQQSNQTWLQEQTTGAGTQIYVSTAGIRQVQQALNKQGFDVGNVNGIWSNQTSRGVQDFQRSKGLEPTGTLTLALINSLGMQNILTSAPQSSGGQGNQRWAQEQAQGPGTPLMISPAGVRQIQQELNKRGYDVGRVDGQWGDSTAQAARNFQRANGLEPNGKPDVNLIAALGGTQAIFQQSGQSSGGGDNNMRWRQEEATGPGVPVWASPATVRQIQQGLNQAGYDVGRVDGQWGQQTARAVQDFQRARGLEPTGTLTTSLLASIGQGNWMQGQIGGGQGQSTGGQGGQQQSSGQGGGSQQGSSGQGGGMQQQGSGQSGGGSQGSQQQQGGFGQSSGSQGGQQQQSSGQSMGSQGGQQQQSGFGQSSGGQGQSSSEQSSGGQQQGFGQSSGSQSSGGMQSSQGSQQ